MKKIIYLIFIITFSSVFSQKNTKESPTDKEILKEASMKSCKCLDSIYTNGKPTDSLLAEINRCIDQQTLIYQLAKKLENAYNDKGNQTKNININTNKNSEDYKEAYYSIERDLMENCKRMKTLVNSNDSESSKSLSKNKLAMEFYAAGIEESKKEDWLKAIENYELAVKKDPNFSFAWDNLGVCYRRIGNYEKALDAYQNSLKADPRGKLPLQNIAIVYNYKKEYQKAIDAFEHLDKIYPGDPEVYYGIGQIYYEYLNNNEKALDYLCKAYNLYVEKKSPYRTDAENIIVSIYKKMKQEGKEREFNEILKINKINMK